MLEKYYEEVSRKKRERWVFWIVVFGLSTFLYLFFQGYYPYVKIDMGSFLGKTGSADVSPEHAKPQIVRAFGIINVRTVPSPDSITVSSPVIGERKVINDDKGFFDFGNYSIDVEKTGYVPVSLGVKLDKENSFSISVLELFQKPVYSPFILPTEFMEDLGGGKLLAKEKESASGSESTLSGSIYRLMDSGTFEIVSSFRTDAKHIGGTLFEKRGAILSYDEEKGLVPMNLKTASGTTSTGLCEEASLDAGKISCPKNGTVLIPHEATLRDRLLGTSLGRPVYAETKTLRVESGRVTSSEPVVTQTGSLPGNVLRLAKNQYRFHSGELFALKDEEEKFDVSPLTSVASVHEFGNESIILGYASEDAAFILVDERGNRYPGIVGKSRISDIRIEPFHGAYLISDGKALYLYYKGSKELTKLVDGKVLGYFSDSAIFEKDGTTYKLDMVAGE